MIIGCDFHTRYQQIAMANDETGELLLERRLDHQSGEAEAFYRSLQNPVRVGIEATEPHVQNPHDVLSENQWVQLYPPTGNILITRRVQENVSGT
jgi:hypothetical protein